MKKQVLDTVSRTIHLPQQLIELVDSIKPDGKKLSKINRDHTYNLIGIIESKSRSEHKVSTGYVPLASDYLKLVFSEKYPRILTPLKKLGIIESDGKFQFGDKSKCLYYRINPKLYQSEEKYIPIKYQFKLLLTDEDHPHSNLYHLEHKELVEGLRIDSGALRSMIEKLITESDSLRDKQKYQTHWMSAIANMEKGSLYARRNKNNLRLDSNWTNMPKKLREKINEDNDFVEVDLTCSQYCVLTLLMRQEGIDSKDALHFYKLCDTGQLYDFLSEELRLTRKKIKTMMYFISFSELHHKSKTKDRFTDLFPSVMKWINDKKKEFGYKEISRLLQITEANIFIDGIKNELMGAEVPNYTVHDSVCVPREYLDITLEIVQYHFNTVGLKGEVKVDGKKKGELHSSP